MHVFFSSPKWLRYAPRASSGGGGASRCESSLRVCPQTAKVRVNVRLANLCTHSIYRGNAPRFITPRLAVLQPSQCMSLYLFRRSANSSMAQEGRLTIFLFYKYEYRRLEWSFFT